MDRIKVGVTYVMKKEFTGEVAESFVVVPVRADLAQFKPDGTFIADIYIHVTMDEYLNTLARLQGYDNAKVETYEEVKQC